MEKLNDLWRVCRAVSTQGRLQLLWLLFEKGELCVNQLAVHSAMTDSNASVQLKILYSAGVIRFRRQEMNVIYRAEADERVECTVELLDILRKCCEQSVPFESVIRQVTAFTHGRRIEIVQVLNNGSLSYNQLLNQSGMTSSALSRHLHKLMGRGVIGREDDVYRIIRPAEPLGKVLLRIVRSC